MTDLRSNDAIERHLKNEMERSLFAFGVQAAAEIVPYGSIKSLLKEGITEESYAEGMPKYTRDNVIEVMREYMGRIGWDKAENHRGISAGRTIEKMEMWIWLLGEDDWNTYLKHRREDPVDYAPYGAPILHLICWLYKFPVPDSETLKPMIQGEPCPDCQRDGGGCTG